MSCACHARRPLELVPVDVERREKVLELSPRDGAAADEPFEGEADLALLKPGARLAVAELQPSQPQLVDEALPRSAGERRRAANVPSATSRSRVGRASGDYFGLSAAVDFDFRARNARGVDPG